MTERTLPGDDFPLKLENLTIFDANHAMKPLEMPSTTTYTIRRVQKGHIRAEEPDVVVVESPLDIIVGYSQDGRREKIPIAATLRTPGDDFNLVTGWLFAEGIIHTAEDLLQVKYGGNTDTVIAELAAYVPFHPMDHERRFPISSACGWCGREKMESADPAVILPHTLRVSSAFISGLPEILRTGQGLFSATGGAHAVALVDQDGTLLLRCEDVGRHNAMDKLLGNMLRKGWTEKPPFVAIFSGRLGYELVQKSLAAGLQIICSIGAPSSAALELAEAAGMTVCGFVRPESFNVYSAPGRIFEP